jgi:hypothetical protein
VRFAVLRTRFSAEAWLGMTYSGLGLKARPINESRARV